MLVLVLMLAGVVHGVDLGHAVGQMTEQTRPDLGVDAFAGGQEAGDFIHALAETGAIFSQDCGVCVQGSCKMRDRRGKFSRGSRKIPANTICPRDTFRIIKRLEPRSNLKRRSKETD